MTMSDVFMMGFEDYAVSKPQIPRRVVSGWSGICQGIVRSGYWLIIPEAAAAFVLEWCLMHPLRVEHVFDGCPNPVSDPALEPDSNLLRRAQGGDQAAFGVIMRAHHERTFRLACAIVHNEADARDICQEVWLTVWKQLPSFRGDSRFSTWLHPIVTRRSLDHLRKRRRWFDRFLPFDTGDDSVASVPEPSTTDDARGHLEGNETVARVRAALATLPPKHRAVLALRELEGLSYEEIAKATGIPAGTVMSRLFHARRLLAEKLGKTANHG
jgi:RNA polymerase sigma-70 factor (ECF subfamily)